MLFCKRLALTVIKSAIRVIVSLNVTLLLVMCGSLASTVSDSENDDDVFVRSIASWFIDDRLQNQTDSKH